MTKKAKKKQKSKTKREFRISNLEKRTTFLASFLIFKKQLLELNIENVIIILLLQK